MPTLRYQALGPLLSGEGSRAFLGLEVIDESAARPVVLVWVPDEAARDARQRTQVERETARAVLLEHPNILRVAGLASLDEGWARVVEFADGEPLRKVLDTVKRLPPEFAALVTADAAMGVHFAHLAGNDDGSPWLHGDLRPETLMVCFSGVTKVTGYGALCVAPRELGGQRVTGRRLHCAPEQIVSGRDTATVQTDVYLLGLILYECLTGLIPFQGAEDFDRAVLTEPLTFPPEAEVPEALQQVVRRAMAKKAPERFANALELRDALHRAVVHLTSPEGFAAYLQTHFPGGDPARAARRRVIDEGIADFARKQWERKSAPAPAPAAAPRAAPPAPPRSTTSLLPKQAAPRAAPRAQRPSEPEEVSSPHHAPLKTFRWKPYALAAAGVVALLLVISVASSSSSKKPSWEERIAANEPKPAPPPAIPPTPPAAAPTPGSTGTVAALAAGPEGATGTTVPASTTVGGAATLGSIDPPAPVPAPAAPEPAPAPEPERAAEPPSLELVVAPPVNVELNGEAVGRSPISRPMPPGRHKVTLTDKARGIQLTRFVHVGKAGKTREQINIGKGIVSVSAPPGAVIAFDGKVMGKAPAQKEFSLYEGPHRIAVSFSGAKWQESFNLKPGERLYFDVTPE